MSAFPSEIAIEAIGSWLVQRSLGHDDLGGLVSGFCERLNEAGLDVGRVAIGSDLLHPIIQSRGYRWLPDEAIHYEEYPRQSGKDEDNWLKSPFYVLVNGEPVEMRRQLAGDYRPGEFPLLDRFQTEGFTDYVALKQLFGRSMTFGEQRGVVASFTTRRPGGYRDADLAFLRRLMPTLALAFKAIDAVHTTRTLVTTYLGSDPARRILEGAIDRGRAEPVDAVLWYSDLQGFTRIADTVPGDELLGLLNDYAETVVTAVREHRGEVLKFVGDGILAMYPAARDGAACADALDAADQVIAEVDALNRERGAGGRPWAEICIALHVGEVLYGNIGSKDRLDFTVVGPAVNEVARIEALSRSLDQQVLVSEAFAGMAGPARRRLVSLGRYALRGVRRPEELFTLDPDVSPAAARRAA